MSKIAVVGGGRGFIGRYLCEALKKDGYDVRIVSRNNSNGAITWTQIEKNGLPTGTSAVFNLAGELVLNPLKRWSQALEDEIRKSRVDTTRLLRDAILSCSGTKPAFWGSTSGVGYYPPDKTLTYNESSVVTDDQRDYWSKLTVAWEEAATIPKKNASEVRHVVLRTGVVMGKGGGALQSMKPAFFLGAGGPVGDGDQWFPWVHMDDVVGIWIHALRNSQVRGVLNGVAPNPVTNLQFSQALGSAMWRPAIVPLPAFAVRTMFGQVRASMLLEGQKVEPRTTLESGYEFAYPEILPALKASI